jgi:hypothetical protein
VIESEHVAPIRAQRRHRPKFEEITKPWSGPIMEDFFMESRSYLYLFTFGNIESCIKALGNQSAGI